MIISGIEPSEHFEIPTGWIRTYAPTSKGVPSAESLTAETAADLVASFVDPALNKSSTTRTWNPNKLTWVCGHERPARGPSRRVKRTSDAQRQRQAACQSESW